MRLDQFISQSSGLSRRDAKQALKEKRVSVNDVICHQPNIHLTATDCVVFDGTRLEWPGELYFMLHKPAGYCCSHDDDGAPSALRLLPDTGKKLHFAGRLDKNTTGLVLVSSDGQWCHRVTSPKQGAGKRKEKHYHVMLEHPLNDDNILQLEQGILLHGETQHTLPAHITLTSPSSCNIAIQEGRYHQIKRMFAAVGNHVTQLHRFRIADIVLTSELPAGSFRPLNKDEINQFS